MSFTSLRATLGEAGAALDEIGETGYYDRDGRPISLLRASWLLGIGRYKRIDYTPIGPRHAVSTVWTGCNFSLARLRPTSFESALMEDGGFHSVLLRYFTEDAAREGHQECVRQAQLELLPGAATWLAGPQDPSAPASMARVAAAVDWLTATRQVRGEPLLVYPVDFGPDGHGCSACPPRALAADRRTLATYVWNGEKMIKFEDLPEPVLAMLSDALAELARQERVWGHQDHPDGTGGPEAEQEMVAAKADCQAAHVRGEQTWARILREEAAEVRAETEPAKVRQELVQLIAVSLNWGQRLAERDRAEPGT